MTKANDARRSFRGILFGDNCVHPASVFDPISARIAEDIGFEVGMLGGSVASLTVLGEPDAILLTLSELADQTRRICRSSPLPLMCDGDHGYGNALNVMRTVAELENAGVAGLSIEDTLLPAPFGSPNQKQMISIDEGVGKIRAALDARQDKDLVIAGRTDAAGITSAEDAAIRLKAYQEAGADVLFAVGVKTKEDLKLISDQTDLPLIVGGVGEDLKNKELLAEHGVRLALQGHQPIAAAARAIYQTLLALRNGINPAELEQIASPDFMKNVMRQTQYRSHVDKYLKG